MRVERRKEKQREIFKFMVTLVVRKIKRGGSSEDDKDR